MDISHTLKAYFENLKKPEYAAHEFERNLMIAKGIFFVLIVILALVNRDTDFMKKSPKGQDAPGLFFFYETMLFAFCGAFGFSFIGAMRSGKVDWMFALKAFAIFAVLNVVLQLAGVLTIALPKEKDAVAEEEYEKALEDLNTKKPRVAKDKDGLNTAMMILLGLVFLFLIVVMIVIAATLRDTTVPQYGGSIFSKTGAKFWIEAVVFAVAASFNFYASARWRTGRVDWSADTIEVALLFVKFFILHILLQTSGVYNHILFKPS
jgi:hypothetical protein